MIKRINILNHADYHGAFKEDESIPGLSRFYCAIKQYYDLDDEVTLLLDAGDNINKVLWPGKCVFDGLKLLGTDAMVLGNHEFDRGKEFLEDCIAYIKDDIPILCSNIVYKDNGELIKGSKAYTIIEKNNIKFGIIGLSSSYTPYIVDKEMFKDFIILDSETVIRKYYEIIKKQDVDIIILLTHFPFYKDGQGELFEVLNNIKDLKIDCFIGGHIPGDYGKVIDNVAISKAGFQGVSLANIKLDYDLNNKKIIKKEVEILDILNDYHVYDFKIDKFVKEITSPYDYYYDEVLAYVKEDLAMSLARESYMGNFIADGVIDRFKTDFVYFNTTSCGRLLPKGNITRYIISKVIAFNDPIQIGKIKGEDIYNLFELIHEPERFGKNANIFFAGLEVIINHHMSSPNKVISIKKDGKEIDKTKYYSVATSKYMANGGNDTSAITNNIIFEDTKIVIWDVLKDYVIKKKIIEKPKLGRYIFIGEPENNNSPW